MKEFFSMNKPFKKYLPIYMITLSIILLMGTSYALLRSSHQGENTYTMNVGTLQVTFVDSETNALTLENAYPMTDDEGMSEAKELTFTVKNTGTVLAKYSVYIEETSTTPEFKSVIRFISNKNNTGYNSPKTLSEDKYIDSESYLDVSETAVYKVKAWISDAADSTYMNKTFTARIVVTGEQASITPEYIRNVIKSKQTSTCKTYVDEDGITYVSGTKDCINFNYVWYSGKLWRITAINKDGTMKMITDDSITNISYNPDGDVNFYDVSKKDYTTYTGSYMYQFLNEDFLDTLYNYQNIIVEDSTWNITDSNASITTAISTKLPETTLINNSTIGKNTPVGLLNSYEYYLSYKNTSYGSGYLYNGYTLWLLNPYNSSYVWIVNNNGYGYNGNPSYSDGARPSINLKSNIQLISGSGTKDDPYTISGDKKQPTINTTLLNTRTVGEYVVFDEDGNSSTKELYRIVGFEDGKTKLNKNDYVKSETTTLTKKFSTNTTYGNGTTDDYWDYYLNNTWYNSLNNKDMLESSAYYIKQVASGTSYKNSLCNTNNTTETTKVCTKTTSVWTGLVGLPRYGEMFASQQGSGYNSSSNIWLITPDSSSIVWIVSNGGYGSSSANPSNSNGARPSINLKSNIVITGGSGTKNDPFTIG